MSSSSFVANTLKDLNTLANDAAVSLGPLDTKGAISKDTLAQYLTQAAQYTQQHGLPFKPDQLPAYLNLLTHGDAIDDRKYLLEDLLSAMARLPPGSQLGSVLQEKVIGLLYDNLPHPPDDWVAEDNSVAPAPDGFEFLHRSADGSNYTHSTPTLGMARTPYARSVPPKTILNKHDLPDPELIFERLLKRDGFVQHPGGISSLFFAFANIIIHCIFSTDQSPGYYRNNVSSYLDLSPLYGSSKADQDSIRRHDGTGKLYNDTYADPRLLFMPPSTNALLVLFSRNHNYIAQQLLDINEDGIYTNPPPTDPKALAYQEEKLFQTARLVNCGFFMQTILGDYVAAILGLVRDGVTWRLDPRIDVHKADGTLSEMGLGNACSIEFNLLYRWHATLAEHDAEWIAEELKAILKGRDPSQVSLDEFKLLLREIRPKGDPKTWTFDGLKRDSEGKYSDDAIAKILLDATDAFASAYKARGTPEILKFVELLTIEQSREWGTCSLNEFRKFIKLKPYETFDEWNSNPEVAKAAQELYGTIDKLELHAGLQAEDAKYVAPGAGLCPGYTISRTILADAVALVRGDPFMTIHNTPKNLTSWGYEYTVTDGTDGSYGGLLTRMLYTLLPEHYPRGSSYAHFPFLVPEAMKGYASKWPGDVATKYTFTRPTPPVGPVVTAKSFESVRRALTDADIFDTGVTDRLNILTRDVGLKREQVRAALYKPEVIAVAAESLAKTVSTLIKQASHLGSGTSLTTDIVKNVLNVLPVHWICSDIVGLGLKTPQNVHGYLLDQDQYSAYAAVSTYVYYNTSPADDWSLREKSLKLADEYISSVKAQLDDELAPGTTLNPLRFVNKLVHNLVNASDNNDETIHRLAKEIKVENDDGIRARQRLAASVFAEYVPTAPIFSKAIANVLNYYLDDAQKTLRENIVELGPSSAILPYIYEALRLDPPISVARVTAKQNTTVDGVAVVAGQGVLASVADAGISAPSFVKPSSTQKIDYLRVLGPEQRGLLAPEYFDRVAPAVVYAILKLKNVRRSNAPAGTISRFTSKTHGLTETICLTSKCDLTPFPASFSIDYDA